MSELHYRDISWRRVIATTILLAVLAGGGLLALGGPAAGQDGGYVSGSPDVEVYLSENTVTPGTEAPVTLQLLNTGNIDSGSSNAPSVTTARGLTVEVEAEDDDVPFTVETDQVAVGDLPTGQPREVPITLDIPEDAAAGEYDLDVSVRYQYTTATGQTYNNAIGRDTMDVTVRIEDRAYPVVENVSSTLSVGYAGSVSGTVTNTGSEALEDGVIRIEPSSQQLSIGEPSYALPELAVGETAEFNYDVDVSGQADPGARQAQFIVEYESGDSDYTVTDRARLAVEPQEPEFGIDIDNATVQAGAERQLAVTITNNRPERLESITANLYANAPLTAVDEEAFTDGLAPGESTELLVSVSAAGSATPKTYPLEFDFQYQDARGEDRISDVYQEPIQVTEAPETEGFFESIGTLGIVIGGVGLLLVIIGGGYWLRQRN